MTRPRIDIDVLTEAELLDLNRRIVERLKFLQQMRAHARMLDFSVGERVCFEPPGRGRLAGIVTRYNRKTVTVETTGGEIWRVGPELLSRWSPPKPAQDVEEVPPEPPPGKGRLPR